MSTTSILPAESSPWRSAGGVLSAEPLTDQKIISLWLSQHENQNTRESYQRTAAAFLRAVGSLDHLTIDRVMTWRQSLAGALSTQGQRISAVKSLLSFAHGFGIHPVNLGRLLVYPKLKDTLAERIISRDQVLAMIQAAKDHQRDHALLRVLYTTGCRVSELTGLSWRDIHHRSDGNLQLTLFGKGGKTRHVVISNPETIQTILAIRHNRGADESVFRSRSRGGHLDRRSVMRCLRKWARRAGLPQEITTKVSTHWFRHSHASHALDAGCPIHEVQKTLGHADVSTTGRYLHVRPDHSSGRFLAI